MFIQRSPIFITQRLQEEEHHRVKTKDEDRVILIKKGEKYKSGMMLGELSGKNFANDIKSRSLLNAFTYGWVWEVLLSATVNATRSRIILAPSAKKKKIQEEFNIRLGAIRNHPSVFGFVRGKSALDCATAHTDFHKGSMGLLVKMDISNFFNSFSEGMVREGLLHHGFSNEEQDTIVENSMMDVSLFSPVVYEILSQLIKTCFSKEGIKLANKLFNIQLVEDLLSVFIDAACRFQGPITDKSANSILYAYTFNSLYRTTLQDLESSGSLNAVSWAIKSILKCGPNTGLGSKMLFQGGPSSPFLSNICFKKIDYRIDAYIKACGGFYTRYADDLCFSFKERRTAKNINLLISGISKIVREGGFVINPAKTHVSGKGRPQKIVGYCVNSGTPTIQQSYRQEIYKEISSISQNCNPVILGGKVAKIEGMISYITKTNPSAAGKLKRELDKATNQSSKRIIEI